MLKTGASYQETAEQFSLNNPSLIYHWMKEFNEKGVEGLKPKPKGRPSMSKKSNTNKQSKKVEKKLTREAELERENELLRLENAYGKKAASFSGKSECPSRKAQAKLAFELKEEGFRLKDILLVVGIPEATYHLSCKKFWKRRPRYRAKRSYYPPI